jgi:hypothetical protein
MDFGNYVPPKFMMDAMKRLINERGMQDYMAEMASYEYKKRSEVGDDFSGTIIDGECEKVEEKLSLPRGSK